MWFKKKAAEKPADKEVSLIDKYRAKSSWVMPKPDYEAMFNEVFKRKISDLRPTHNTDGSVAMDSDFALDASVPAYNCVNDIPNDIFDFYGAHSFIGWNACTVLRQNPYIDKACTIPAADAIRPDYKITYADDQDEDVDEQKLVNIKKISDEDFRIKEACYQLTVNKKTFGIGLAVPIVDGVDYSKPYNIDGVKKGAYKGFTIVEPYWVAPQLDADAVSNPLSRGFQEPTWWRMPNGVLVHKSWIIKVVNSVVPDILKPTYYYGGLPLTQLIYERVYAAEKCANEAPQLALTKRMLIADADVDSMVANPSVAQNILKAIQWCRDNFSVWFKNPGDQVQQIDTSLADFDALVYTQYQLVASIAEMPATKLLKTTPKGFNSTGEYELKDYIQSLQAIQERDYLPLLKRHFQLFTKSYYGEEIKLNTYFNPVDMPTEKDVAEIAEIQSRIDTNYISAGVTSAEEVRDILRADADGRYSTLAEEMEGESSELNFNEEEVGSLDAMDAEPDNFEWVTVKGNHIPVKEGETKKEAAENFIESKTSNERPYSNKQIKDILAEHTEEAKEKLVDIYNNHFEKYGSNMQQEIKRRIDIMASLGEIDKNSLKKYKDIEEKEAKAHEEQRQEEERQQAMANLKLPQKINKEYLKNIFKKNGFNITSEYVANTGSEYITVNLEGTPYEDVFPDAQLRLSIRDHYEHAFEYVEPDIDLMVDKPNNWQDTVAYIAKKLDLKGAEITKIKKYVDLDKKR